MLVIVGPGIMPIPPPGWGAVESLIWDYSVWLKKRGVEVAIVNTPHTEEIIRLVNSLNPTVVHIQYDNHWGIVPHLNCKNVIMTSHYGYLDSLHLRPGDNYMTTLQGFINSPAYIQALSPSIRDVYIRHGADPNKVSVIHNGADHTLFRYTETPLYPNKSIYLAKIDYRKRQHVYQDIPFIDFAGNYADRHFNPNRPNYLGEWQKPTLYEKLTDYANLVLLSDGEAHPLVCCEALVAGLGLVVSTYAAANLDTALPWIDVIPNERLNDIPYVATIILENQKKACQYRAEIRAYALQHFTWERIIDKYLQQIEEWFFSPPIVTNG